MKKIWIAATFDTKADEANYLRDLLLKLNLPVIVVDLSTIMTHLSVHVDITAREIATFHPHGVNAVFTGDRGSSISAMTEAFSHFILTRDDIGAMLGIGGSGGTAMITSAMRELPIGIPKIMVSTMASGDVSHYIGASDICMMSSITDLVGLNRISKCILSNAAGAIAGAFLQACQLTHMQNERLLLGMTMFGITTSCVQQLKCALESKYDCMIFHATGTGGRTMEKLLDDGHLDCVIDITTTEVCDFMFGGILPCTNDRFAAIARTQKPAIISCGALDAVNFGPRNSVPERYKDRLFYQHNAQITLMRTTPEENRQMGQWIAERLNNCHGPVRVMIPEGGVSELDMFNKPFWDPKADQALFDALERSLRHTHNRQLIRTPYHINSNDFSEIVLQHFNQISTLETRHDQT